MGPQRRKLRYFQSLHGCEQRRKGQALGHRYRNNRVGQNIHYAAASTWPSLSRPAGDYLNSRVPTANTKPSEKACVSKPRTSRPATRADNARRAIPRPKGPNDGAFRLHTTPATPDRVVMRASEFGNSEPSCRSRSKLLRLPRTALGRPGAVELPVVVLPRLPLLLQQRRDHSGWVAPSS